MRYDPETGRKYKVTADDPRYDEWPSRKPGKYAKEASKFTSRPAEYIAEQTIKRAHRKSATLGRKVTGAAGAILKNPVISTAVGGAVSIAAGLAIIAAASAVADQIAKSGRLELAAKLNRLSNDFVATQRTLLRAYGVADWQHVPQQVRDEAVKSYKRALATASAQAQGSAYVGRRAEGSYK